MATRLSCWRSLERMKWASSGLRVDLCCKIYATKVGMDWFFDDDTNAAPISVDGTGSEALYVWSEHEHTTYRDVTQRTYKNNPALPLAAGHRCRVWSCSRHLAAKKHEQMLWSLVRLTVLHIKGTATNFEMQIQQTYIMITPEAFCDS